MDVTLEQLADAFQDNHDRFYRDWFLTRSRYRQDRFHSTLHLPEDS